jgi:hypothetical protein
MSSSFGFALGTRSSRPESPSGGATLSVLRPYDQGLNHSILIPGSQTRKSARGSKRSNRKCGIFERPSGFADVGARGGEVDDEEPGNKGHRRPNLTRVKIEPLPLAPQDIPAILAFKVSTHEK